MQQKESIRNNTTKSIAYRNKTKQGTHQEKKATKRIPKLTVKTSMYGKRGVTAQGTATNNWLSHRQVLMDDMAKEVHLSTVAQELQQEQEQKESIARARAARELLGVE